MKSNKALITMMLEEASALRKLTAEMPYERFAGDWSLVKTSERVVEEIGQIAKDLGDDVLENISPAVPWKEIIGMRDIIAHDYAEVDMRIMWSTVCGQDLSDLISALESYLKGGKA